MIVHMHLASSGWKERYNGAIKQRGACSLECESLVKLKNTNEISHILQQQNGFYALVWQQGNTTYAAVDHIRSIPLFYALKETSFYLSDDADWVRAQVGNTVIDEVAKEEFQMTGYVTGQETLYPDVKQLQAGEFLSINTRAGAPQLKTERYYRFLHTEPENYDEQVLYQQLDAAALASIDNLIRYANGRQIVIPLSGGYDSRLIATLLKRRGYENILTFTYGVPGNKESSYSKKVAETLGLKWHFVEYNNALWREAWQTEERWQYQKWASGWNSIAHVQDWLAVKILKANGVVESDCIFAPGHSGDFVAGSHIPDIAFSQKDLNLFDSCWSTFTRHYSLAPLESFMLQKAAWLERIQDRVESNDFCSNINFADTFEKWDWQERQAKFICNSVRVYEFFGYDWWLPLWDMEFVRFWQGVPLELREGRKWYLQYVQALYLENSEEQREPLNNASDDTSLKAYLKSTALYKSDNVAKTARRILNLVRSVKKPQSHLAFEGWFDQEFYKTHKENGYCVNGMIAKYFLISMKKNEKS